MPNTELMNLYADMQNEMRAVLNSQNTAITHPGSKGDATEMNWISFLKDYLPKRYDIDRGFVIDSKGNTSEQIDIIIYDKQYSHFVFRQNGALLIPVEGVYAVFEVKQNLNKEHIEYAGQKANSVRELYRTSAPIKHAGGEFPPKPLHEIVAGILTTTSDWVEPITRKVCKYILGSNHFDRLDLVCALSSGTYVADSNTFIDNYKEDSKVSIEFCNESSSLVFLLLSLLKKLQNIGTVPAIDFSKYAEAIQTDFYKEK